MSTLFIFVVIVLVLGFAIGYFIASEKYAKLAGELQIKDDEDGVYFFLCLNTETVNDILESEKIVLEVVDYRGTQK